jgi:chitin synthase
MLPTYINMLCIYAYCNLHDLSWGTKGLEANTAHSHTYRQKQSYLSMKDQLREAATQAAELAREQEETRNEFCAFRTQILFL